MKHRRTRPDEPPTDAAPVELPDAAADEGAEPAPDTMDPQLEELQREVSTLTDRHLRLAAEFDNYRKRTDRERADLYARAQGDLVKRLLESIDDLERVADYAETSTSKSLLEGVQLVEKKLLQSLRAAGLEAIEPDGQPFDPSSMEAVGVVTAETPEQDGLVADVFQKGYRFGGTLIRAARVRVLQHED